MSTICLTSQFRVFAALSSDFEVALRYCGVSVLLCTVFGGYVLSIDKMIQNVPWVGWIAVSRSPRLFERALTFVAVYDSHPLHLRVSDVCRIPQLELHLHP